MATVVAVQPINMSSPNVVPGTATNATLTQITVVGGNQTGIYTGQFVYSNGFLAGGTVNDYQHFINGQLAYRASNLSVDALVMLQPTSILDLYSTLLKGNDLFLGSQSSDWLIGFSGNDEFVGNGGNDTIDGSDGQDTATYHAQAVAFTISALPSGGIQLDDHIFGSGVDTVFDIEQLKFRDLTIDATWISKAAIAPRAQLVDLIELYIASFDRAPDALGLQYWASRVVDGMTIQEIARSFFVQPETLAAYPAGMSTTDFVTKVYDNVLGRAPDQPGLTYWVNQLDQGAVSKDTFLLAIIYGARAPTGSRDDAQYLYNKEIVAAHFAVTRGLTDVNAAKNVLAGVDATSQSVDAAMALVDQVAADPTPHLMVQLVGVDATPFGVVG